MFYTDTQTIIQISVTNWTSLKLLINYFCRLNFCAQITCNMDHWVNICMPWLCDAQY